LRKCGKNKIKTTYPYIPTPTTLVSTLKSRANKQMNISYPSLGKGKVFFPLHISSTAKISPLKKKQRFQTKKKIFYWKNKKKSCIHQILNLKTIKIQIVRLL
jgi:hypothetical protein